MKASGRVANIDLDKIDAVSWDVDGTLYSVGRLRARLVADALLAPVLGRGTGKIRDLVRIRALYRGAESARSTGRAWRLSENDLEARLALERQWLGPALEGVGVRPGTTELLRYFQELGLKQVAVSDFECRHKLESLGVAEHFESAYAAERIGALKPDPTVFHRVFDDLGISPHRLLHIGDRPETDGVAARFAKCNALLLGRDFRDFRQLVREFSSKSTDPSA